MRVRRPLAVSATLTAIVIGAGIGALQQSVTGRAAASTDPATLRTLRYLQSQAGTDGSLASSAGATEDGVIGFADNGYDPATLRSSGHPSAIDYLTGRTQSGTTTTDTAGHTAKLILAVTAAHLDPTAFGGRNLVTTLTGYYSSSTGAYASTAASESPNVFSQSFSVLALIAASQTVPAKALDLLVCARRSDGSYGYAVTAAATLTSPNCADTSGDTNSSAIAVQALVAGGRTVDSGTLTWLHSVQQTDAGFGFDGSGPSDPDSDATVIQALIAAGQDPASAGWTKAGHTPPGNLLTFQDSGGGFTYPGNPGPDAFTTSEVPAALAGRPYGAATTFAPGATAATPAPTATPTRNATPVATPTPTATTSASVAAVGPPNTGGGDAELPAVPAVAAAAAALGVTAAAILWRRRTVPSRR